MQQVDTNVRESTIFLRAQGFRKHSNGCLYGHKNIQTSKYFDVITISNELRPKCKVCRM